MKRLALALTVSICAILSLGQLVSAQYDRSVSSSTTDGRSVVTYSGCVSGETITFNLPGATPETAPGVCANGTASAVFTDAAGKTGTASGTTSPLVNFTVASIAPAPTSPPTGLPATGSSDINIALGPAIGLLVVGLGLFVVAHVRRRQPNLS